jgi:ADP-heptose:LPS heptosyltransferase
LSLKNKFIQSVVRVLKPKSPNLGAEKRFLILSSTGLGDTLWGTPAIRALRECFPKSYIGIVASPLGQTLLQHNPRIDEIFMARDPLLPSLFSLYRALKVKHITHVLSFHTSQRALLPLSAMLGAQEIIGTEGINKGLDTLLTHPLKHPSLHEIERRLDIAAQAGAHTLDSSMELFLSPEDEKAANTFLEDLHIPRSSPLIGIHPGAKDLFKRWPASHFIELGNRLVRTLNCRIVVTGNPCEKSLADQISSHIEGAVSATHLPLLTTAALIKQIDLMITNDTGPMHLAFAQKIPTLALFAPTDPRLCGPHTVSSARIIAKGPTCRPCLRKKCLEPFCLRQIGVEEVYDAALNLYREGFKNGEMPRRRPEFEPGEAGDEADKLKKFIDAGEPQMQWLLDVGRTNF